MKKVILFLSFVILFFLTSCISTGQFETAHTLPKGDYNYSWIGFMGVQTEADVVDYLDSSLIGSMKVALNKGISDGLEFGIETDFLFVTNIKFKQRLTDLDKPFALAIGPTISVAPFSVLLQDNFFGGPYSPFLSGGISLYSSYQWNNWTAYVNTHGLYYSRKSILYKDFGRSTNFGFGFNGGIIRELVENKMSVGLQFSIERLDTFLESCISMGVIYHYSTKSKKH